VPNPPLEVMDMKLQKHRGEPASFQKALLTSEAIALLAGACWPPWSHRNTVHYCTPVLRQAASWKGSRRLLVKHRAAFLPLQQQEREEDLSSWQSS